MKRYEHLEEALCKELEKLDKKYSNETGEMSEPDAQKADMLYHALKSAETYHAMKDSWDDGMSGTYHDGRSYARGRDRMGRYVSRDMGGEYSGFYPMDYRGWYR